ncbi:hypothetical protein BDW74DRAFT_181258 [Aspergillus multicolor]|uniref:uncharacterized protein n=1 Tax=Aspergillus multicolor TaxID=41759 RepID=UPI003CCD6D4C
MPRTTRVDDIPPNVFGLPEFTQKEAEKRLQELVDSPELLQRHRAANNNTLRSKHPPTAVGVAKALCQEWIWNDDWNVTDGPPPLAPWSHEAHSNDSPGTQNGKRDGSRPYNQFMYQLEAQRRRCQELDSPHNPGSIASDVNTKAYDHIHGLWVCDNLWNPKWGVLPGPSWNHEILFEEWLQDRLDEEQTWWTTSHDQGLGNDYHRAINFPVIPAPAPAPAPEPKPEPKPALPPQLVQLGKRGLRRIRVCGDVSKHSFRGGHCETESAASASASADGDGEAIPSGSWQRGWIFAEAEKERPFTKQESPGEMGGQCDSMTKVGMLGGLVLVEITWQAVLT